MSSVATRTSVPTVTPLSSVLYQDLIRHTESVRNNEVKALQLRPILERRRSESILSSRSSTSPPPDLDFLRAVPRGSGAYDTPTRTYTRVVDLTKAAIDSPFIDLDQPHHISIMTKNGIFNLYVSHTQDHINQHETSGKVSKISRARVELELLTGINNGDLPIEYKLCWNKAILSSNFFESFWLDNSRRLKIPRASIERYKPSDTLLEYETPTSSDSEAGPSRSGIAEQRSSSDSDNFHVHPTQLTEPSTKDKSHEEEYITPEAAAFARRLGGEGSSVATSTGEVPSFDPRGVIGLDLNGLARETGDDGAWGSSKKDSKSKPTRHASSSTQAIPRTPRPTPPKDQEAAKASAAKRVFAAIGDEVGPHGTPQKKAKKNSAENGTSAAGRQRKKTAKAKAIVPGQI